MDDRRARPRRRPKARRFRPFRTLPLLLVIASLAAPPAPTPKVAALPSGSSTTAVLIRPATAVENWTGLSRLFTADSASTSLDVAPIAGTQDGLGLRLRLPADPQPGPGGGVEVVSRSTYQFGSFGTRMRTADCTGQDRVGVVTGTFTYSTDHSDANRNGIPDNDEIDIEMLCAQPEVVYLTLWTDYSETSNALRSITRSINLRTGKVLSTCSVVSYGSGCQPLLPGENAPSTVPAIAGFNSATQWHSYAFDWQRDRVRFSVLDGAGRQVVLWDYRGPQNRIPQKSSTFRQNVWHTPSWDPLSGPAHERPKADTSAYLDSSVVPDYGNRR